MTKHESEPYKLVINWVNSLSYIPKEIYEDKKSSIILKLYFTFYSKTMSKFFGNTYSSSHLKLNKNAEGKFETNDIVTIYYHTTLDESKEPVIILEA